MTPRRDAGRLDSRLRAVLLAVVVLAVAVAVPLVAQTPAHVPVLDGIAAHYRDAARLWRPRLLPIAQQLFMLLASLEFAVSGAIWALGETAWTISRPSSSSSSRSSRSCSRASRASRPGFRRS